VKSGKSQAAAYPPGGNPGSSSSPRAGSSPSVAVRSNPKYISDVAPSLLLTVMGILTACP